LQPINLLSTQVNLVNQKNAPSRHLLDQVPTTDEDAAYGSPEMASSIVNLLRNSGLRQQKIFVMRGHPEGIFAFEIPWNRQQVFCLIG